MATIETFHTQNSTYQLDREGGRIRRIGGFNAPTPHQGTDGQWQKYEGVEMLATGCVLIHWDSQRATLTTVVRGGWDQS